MKHALAGFLIAAFLRALPFWAIWLLAYPLRALYALGRLSTETGCITVRRQAQGTVSIEGLLLRSEGSNAQCPIE